MDNLQPQPVLVRTYPDDPAFVADAAQLAAFGYRIVSRTWSRTMTNAARQVALLGVLAALLAAVAAVPALYLGALVAFGVALVGRVRVLTVTYQQG